MLPCKLLPLLAPIAAAGNSLEALLTASKPNEVKVSDEEFEDFKFWVQYAAAAYCNYDKQPGDLVTCAGDECDDVMANNATIVTSAVGAFTDASGFVAVDPEREAVVVSFRGTKSFLNTLTDLSLRLTDCPKPYPSNCEVHVGFLSAWSEVEEAVLSAVSAALDDHPHYEIVATGHSLGGAIATIAAAFLREANGYTDLYTYGSPRVGNTEFVEYVESLPGGNFRLTHAADPVPPLPPSLLGYRHMSPEYWLVGDSMREEFGVRNVTVCVGLLNFECNGSTLLHSISPLEHSYYFQKVSGCEDDGWGLEWLEDKLPDGMSFGAIEDVIKADREDAGKDVDG